LARLQHDPVKPRHVRAGVPKALEDVTMRALAREPAQRYASAGDLRAARLAVSRGEVPEWSAPGSTLAGSPDSTVAVAPARDRTPAGGVDVRPVPTQPRRGRMRVLPVLVICLLAAALIIGGILITGTDHSSSSGTSSTPADATAGVRIANAVAFDPFGGDGEHDAEAGLAI